MYSIHSTSIIIYISKYNIGRDLGGQKSNIYKLGLGFTLDDVLVCSLLKCLKMNISNYVNLELLTKITNLSVIIVLERFQSELKFCDQWCNCLELSLSNACILS